MAISGVGSNYGNVYGSTYMAQKNEAVKKTETKEAAPAQAKNTGADSVSDYRRCLKGVTGEDISLENLYLTPQSSGNMYSDMYKYQFRKLL